MEGKQISVELGESRDFGMLIVGFESFKNGVINLRVVAKDGGIPWESEPPPKLKYLTSRPRAVT